MKKKMFHETKKGKSINPPGYTCPKQGLRLERWDSCWPATYYILMESIWGDGNSNVNSNLSPKAYVPSKIYPAKIYCKYRWR